MNMELPIKIFGARASVLLRYEGDIQSLAQTLSKGLKLPDFQIAPSERPPYETEGSVEALGWEIWLKGDRSVKTFHYSLSMETENSETESFGGDMHDLSPWLARYISRICGVESLIKGTKAMFSRGHAKICEGF